MFCGSNLKVLLRLLDRPDVLLAERLQRRHELFVRVLQHSLHLVFDLERNEWLDVCRESGPRNAVHTLYEVQTL